MAGPFPASVGTLPTFAMFCYKAVTAVQLPRAISWFHQQVWRPAGGTNRDRTGERSPAVVASPREVHMNVSTRRSRVIRLGLLAAAGAALVAAPASSAALPAPALAVSPPQGSTAGFATLQVVAVQGQEVQLLNADSIVHTLQSKATKPVKVLYGRKTYTVHVPMFDSGPVAGASAGPVKGVLKLKPGSYEFLCGLHTNMTGTLVIEPSPVVAKGR